MAVGGDIIEISDNHPTLGSFVYKVVVGQDNTYDTGGFRSADNADMRTGGGEMITQINGKLGFFQAVIVNDMTQKVAERLSQLSGSVEDSVWTFSVVNNKTYKGAGRPVGDVAPNINNSQVTLKVAGPSFLQV